MDTKSKKMRNLKVLIITLTILLPAIVLVALYPRMGQAYEQRLKEIETQESAIADEAGENIEVSGTDVSSVVEPIAEVDYLPNEQIVETELIEESNGEDVEVTEHVYYPKEAEEIPEVSEAPELLEGAEESVIIEKPSGTNSEIVVEENVNGKVAVDVNEETTYVIGDNGAGTVTASEAEIVTVEAAVENPLESEAEYELGNSLVNYAMEASYYLYGQMLQDARETAVDFSVLDHYGWINDYYTLAEDCDYYVEFKGAGNGITGRTQSEYDLSALFLEKQDAERKEVERWLQEEGCLGYLILQFDEYGNISDVRFNGFGNIISYGNLYQHAKESIDQYENNVSYYNDISATDEWVDSMELRPKNFKAVYVVDEDSQFVFYRMTTDAERYHYNPYNIFVSMGVEWLILVAVIFVAAMAFILPFFKKLNTGWEKLFCIPAEIICVIAGCAIGGIMLMFELMYSTCYPVLMETLESYGPINIIGYDVAPDTIYYIMLGVNFIGWALVFFMEYISVTALRQFLFRPLFYLKNRLIVVMICRWFIGLFKKAYHYVTDINIGKGLNKSIWKIVIANALIVGILCCFWFMGWFGVIVYSIVLYIILRKYGFKLQRQYESILNVTKEMAEGNLKAEVASDLGVFTELGEELKTVQAGFSKAVAEEAKSQNMKTELITNVSHDLKTPLTAIITYVDLLKKEELTEEERKEYVETLDKKSQRLKVLIEDLFEVSKATTNNITMYYTDIDLVNLLKQVCLENEDKIADSTLDFRWNLPEKKCIAHLDPNRTYRIIDNLLQNALKYSMPHSRVYVDMEEALDEYEISFKNMSAAEMNFDASEITERFVRGDLSRNTEGSGLGLAIARSFTELQNGKFEVEIDGDLFKVTLRFLKKAAEG